MYRGLGIRVTCVQLHADRMTPTGTPERISVMRQHLPDPSKPGVRALPNLVHRTSCSDVGPYNPQRLTLTPGTRLGPYEIISALGAGGMGEVWKARDTRVDRIVAIKRLKAEHAERFKREARAIAALNHPRICQLYDVGPDYLVMEYVEGEPLKGPVARGRCAAAGACRSRRHWPPRIARGSCIAI